MIFSEPLITATLVKRYKRFLADVRLENGEIVTAHCPNPGSMKSCLAPDWPVRLSFSRDSKRKLPYTLEMTHNGQCWIGLNTQRPNFIVKEAIAAGKIPELQGYGTIRCEVPYGQKSRIDLLLEDGNDRCYVEVKNVTLRAADGGYAFPDAVTTRGQKHLRDLMGIVRQGQRAVMFYLIQRTDGHIFRPAADIDPDYARLLSEAFWAGVEILAYVAEVSPAGIVVAQKIRFELA
jgi:sugar fermentation stimulation protein A